MISHKRDRREYRPDHGRQPRGKLVPPAGADVGVLRRDNPPAPVDLAHNARADALPRRLAKVVVQDFAIDPEARVQDCDVGREKVHMHLRRLARARSITIKRFEGRLIDEHNVRISRSSDCRHRYLRTRPPRLMA